MRIFKNILHLFRLYPVSMGLNLAGLTIAFCAFAGIMDMVRYEDSFDSFHPDHEDIFRVDQKGVDGTFRSVLPPGFADAVIAGSAHIEAGTLYCPFSGEQYMVIRDSLGQEHGFISEANNVSGDFFKVFGIKVIEGSADALADPAALALPASLAVKMFGNTPAVGRHIEILSGAGFVNGTDWTVGAVYEDLPDNSQIRNNVLLPIPDFFMSNFTSSNFLCYLRLDDRSNAERAAEDFNGNFDFSSASWMSPVELTPLEDVYYLEEGSDSRIFRSGSRSRTMVLMAVAVLILLAGTFNYANFYTSLIPSRLRSINTAKVFGASVQGIRLSLLAETMLLSLLACLFSFILMYCAAGMGADSSVIAVCLVSAVLSGLCSGVYPAYYATSVEPAMVLKGRSGLPPYGRRLRNILLFVQLVISSALLVFVSYVWMQNDLLGRYDCGFDKDRIAVADLTTDMISSSYERFRDGMMSVPGIEGVAFASEKVGGQEVYSTETVKWRDGSFQTFVIWCTYDFPDVMGIPVKEGRGFAPGDRGSAMFNESAKSVYGLEEGAIPSMEASVKGFCGDVRFNSLKGRDIPVCFRCIPDGMGFTQTAYVRFSEDMPRTRVSDAITAAVHAIDPAYPVEVMFYDDIQAELYAAEHGFRRTLMIFSAVAVLLSLSGVFSMVMFDIQSRRRDTAVRRVFGATFCDVALNANRTYMAVSAFSVLAGIPLGWLAVSSWLQNFAVKVAPGPWVFLCVIAVVPALVGAVVTLRTLAAAGENPATVLGGE